MLSFRDLQVSDEIKSILMNYKVDFVFQPIFSRDSSVIGYEALMRPEGTNILDFIEDMKNQDKLHDMELLTFFGATLAYIQRKYDKLLSINSFPAECFSTEEATEFLQCFRHVIEKLIVEILEYTDSSEQVKRRKQVLMDMYEGAELALDDFGTGHNNMQAVDYYKPHMIKLDRSLISGIDKDREKQETLVGIVKDMHKRTVAVLAEGVETKEEYDYLQSAGVDFFQGYYLGRPS